jgi:Iron-containing redox enzyme
LPAPVNTWARLAPTAPRPPLPGTARLARTELATITSDSCVRLEVGAQSIELGGDALPYATRFVELADGTRTLDQLAATLGEHSPTDEIARVVFEHGAFLCVSPDPLPALSFHDHAVAVGRALRAAAHARHPVLSPQRSTPREVLGTLLESLQLVNAAASHIGMAITAASTPRLRAMFAEYLSDEYWHGPWLEEGLIAGGLDPAMLAAASPMPETMALVNYLRWTAHSDILSYAVCLGIAESPAATPGIKESQAAAWDALVEHGLIEEPLLRRFREHELVDLEGAHDALSAEPFAELHVVTPEEQKRVLRTVSGFVATMEALAAAIHRFYGDERNPPFYTCPMALPALPQ